MVADTDTGGAAEAGFPGAVLGQAALEDQEAGEEETEHSLQAREMDEIVKRGISDAVTV